MKHLLIISFSIASLSSAMAQEKESVSIKDSTKVTTRQGDGQLISQPQPDLIKLKSSDIPASLRKTLQKSKYKGWENSMIYKQKSTNEYLVEIMENGKTKTYRFDENGEPLKKEDN